VPSPEMKSGQRKLSEVARHIRQPVGIVSTGWPSVRDRLAQFSIPFDVWQQGTARLILAKRADGIYAAGVGGVVISIPRQVGKTYMIGWIVFALCTLIPGMTVIWTAHHTRTSNETFGKMRSMARRAKVAPYIEAVRAANGEQSVVFKNESRILFGARDQGFGLGFDMVDVLVLDEGQRVKEVAMADMVPATNAAPNGLVIMMGTPPRPTDNGDVFAARRKDALGGDPDTLYIELSADQDAKIIDWEQVAKANPSFPHRTSKTAILRMQKLLGSDEGFMREGYGIWDDPKNAGVIPAKKWADSKIQSAELESPVVSVDFRTGLEQSYTIVVTGDVGDKPTVDVARYEQGFGKNWTGDHIANEVALVCAGLDLDEVVIDVYGDGNALLIPKIEDLGLTVRRLNMVDMRNAAVAFRDAVVNGRLQHVISAASPPLDVAVAGAATRKSGNGFVWAQDKATADLTPLRAASAGLWVHHTTDADYNIEASVY
jgi:hypothetical protein